MYGLIGGKHRLNQLAWSVCDCLGNGKNKTAVNLLIETAGVETAFGEFKDSSLYAGMGITQFDKLPFQDVKDRTNDANAQRVYDYFGIDINLVEWEHLRYNPLLCMIFTRLKYKLIEEEIPLTLEFRAKYWKRYYNTTAGAGKIEDYLRANA